MKNACIVGYGAIGPIHARGITNAKKGNLYAVCDINPQKIKLCQEHYKDVIGFTDFYEMLKDTDIDCVHICTPHYLHYEMITAALNAGKKVIKILFEINKRKSRKERPRHRLLYYRRN